MHGILQLLEFGQDIGREAGGVGRVAQDPARRGRGAARRAEFTAAQTVRGTAGL